MRNSDSLGSINAVVHVIIIPVPRQIVAILLIATVFSSCIYLYHSYLQNR